MRRGCGGWATASLAPIGVLVTRTIVSLHEAAVPSILNLITRRGGGDRTSVRAPQVIDSCFGCCCCDVAQGELDTHDLLAAYPCGHRIALNNGRARDALAHLLTADTRERTNCTLVELDAKLKYTRCT